jgi:alanyl-tRNA synthetase
MLGNFSFGDYFKKEAIEYAWEFLTKVMGLPEERLWVTVFEEDDEAADLWLKHIGVSKERFSRIGAKDNFWSMGDTGPCGPCTEIFYDHGPEVAGGPPGTPEEDGDRYIEIWNLVFMQYDRDTEGNLNPLPKPSVDTGMGLERLAAIMQGGHSNYDIDLFQYLIRAIADLADEKDLNKASLKVIADHIRSCSFLIVDGVMPSNEGRGYVLRRIIRRAARHGHMLGLNEPFFYKIVAPLVDQMGEAYPELAKVQSQVERVLRKEEERFAETLEHGLKILEEDIVDMAGDLIPGETVFKLYDTYGFPVDLTADIARERSLTLDMPGFEREMEAQRERARAASQFGAEYTEALDIDVATEFTGYQSDEDRGKVLALFHDGKAVERLGSGEAGRVILDRSPFYAESGGQIGDTGELTGGSARFTVSDTQKQGQAFAHIGTVAEGTIGVGDELVARIDTERRQAIKLNHSATHLMHAALRQVLGEHVQQKGSLVTDQRLRFDFSHNEPVKPEELREIEHIVNQQIRDNTDAHAAVMSMDDALKEGAMALFGEKYGDEVRVMKIGFSTELCGGVHVSRAGDIGLFKIINEGGVASGIRRIEAVTGNGALEYIEQESERLDNIARLVKASHNDVDDKVEQLIEKSRGLEKSLEQLKARLASQAGSDLTAQAVEVQGIKVLAAELEGADVKTLRETMDQLKNKLGQAAVVLASVNDDKVVLVAGVTKEETTRIKAGDLVNHVAQQVGGRGGGRPDMAQAGGSDPSGLAAALKSVPDWAGQQLA